MSTNKSQEQITDFKQYELDLYHASNIGGVYTVRMDERWWDPILPRMPWESPKSA